MTGLMDYRSLLAVTFLLSPCLGRAAASAVQLEVGSGQTYGTITDAIVAASAGDVVNVHSGNYKESITIPATKPSLTLKASAGASPCLTGNIRVQADNITIDGFEVRGWTGAGPTASGVYMYSGDLRTGLTVKNCIIHAGTGGSKSSFPIDVNGTRGAQSCGIFVRNHTKTTITNVEVYGCITGLYTMSCKSSDGTFANGTVMSSLNIHDNKNDGIDIEGQYITLQDSRVYDNYSGESSARGYHSDAIQAINSSGANGNQSTDGTGCVQHLRILRNTFANASQLIFIEGPNAKRSMLVSSPYMVSDVLIANNVCYIEPRGANIHGRDPGADPTVGCSLKYADDCKFFNNTVVNAGIGIGTSKHTYVQNNIFIGCKIPLIVPNVRDLAAGAIDNNILDGYNNAAQWDKIWYKTLRRLQRETSSTGNNQHSLEANPLLISPSTPRLKLESPARRAGRNLSAYFNTDRDGVSRREWDIGAYAYQPHVGSDPAATRR